MMCAFVKGPLEGKLFPVLAHTKLDSDQFVIIKLTRDVISSLEHSDDFEGQTGGLNNGEEVLFQTDPEIFHWVEDYQSNYRWFLLNSYCKLQDVVNNKEVKHLLKKE